MDLIIIITWIDNKEKNQTTGQASVTDFNQGCDVPCDHYNEQPDPIFEGVFICFYEKKKRIGIQWKDTDTGWELSEITERGKISSMVGLSISLEFMQNGAINKWNKKTPGSINSLVGNIVLME